MPPLPTVCAEDGDVIAGRSWASSAPDRYILGEAAPYPADLSLSPRFEDLRSSQRQRRNTAWEAVTRVLAPTNLAEATALGESTVPAFRTYYDTEDFRRLFRHLFSGLSSEQRAAQARFTPSNLDDAFLWNVGFVDELGTWPEERLNDYLADIDTDARLHALGGLDRGLLSPAAARHVMESYPEVLRCLTEGAPPTEVPIEVRSDRILREVLRLSRCESRSLGTWTLSHDEALEVFLEEPVAGSAGATIQLLRIDSFDETGSPRATPQKLEVCRDEAACVVERSGVYEARLVAPLMSVDVVVEVRRRTERSPVACLAGAFPPGSVSVAAEWRRVDAGIPFPTFDTSAAALSDVLSQETPTWEPIPMDSPPEQERIFTQRLQSGAVFALAGMHLRTNEMPLGMHITLWWSDRPDEDFGADRPEAIRALGGVWSNYKMCVATAYAEMDHDPSGGYATDRPSLGAALTAVYEGQGEPTWCSNPYIDGAPGLAAGNCIGCHQHGMTDVRPETVATDSLRFPMNGRLPARNNNPADGSWALDAGSRLGIIMSEIVQFYSNP